MTEVKDQTSHGEGSQREDEFSHQVDNNNQTSHIQAQLSNLSLMEANETIITENGHPPPLPGPANSNPSTENSNPPITIYTFQTPTALQNFLTTQPPTSIKTIRLVILHPLESTRLTLNEQRDSKGPNLTPLFDAWRNAFKTIPPTVQLIQVDISHSPIGRTEDFHGRAHMLGKLAQLLSTTVYLRSGRKTRFEVVGAKTEGGKAFVEAGMVGLREGSAVSRGKERLRIGAE